MYSGVNIFELSKRLSLYETHLVTLSPSFHFVPFYPGSLVQGSGSCFYEWVRSFVTGYFENSALWSLGEIQPASTLMCVQTNLEKAYFSLVHNRTISAQEQFHMGVNWFDKGFIIFKQMDLINFL